MLPIIPSDKANHFAYGAAAATVMFVLVAQVATLNPFAHIFALAAAALVGVAKEGFDYMQSKRGGDAVVDKLDVLWTALGGVPVFVTGIVA